MAESKKLTITLTNRPPVKITVDDWPILAEATSRDWDGEHEFQASRTSKMALRVRQHQDGRVIVYGSYAHSTNWQTERNVSIRRGELLEPTVRVKIDQENGCEECWELLRETVSPDELSQLEAADAGEYVTIRASVDPGDCPHGASESAPSIFTARESVDVTPEKIIAAIWRVAEDIDGIGEGGDRYGLSSLRLAHECIADIPAVEI